MLVGVLIALFMFAFLRLVVRVSDEGYVAMPVALYRKNV
jgi:hypothetical protein